MTVLARDQQRELVGAARLALRRIAEAGPDHGQLSPRWSTDDRYVEDLHVRPTQALDAVGAGRDRHRPSHRIVRQGERRSLLDAEWAGMRHKTGRGRGRDGNAQQQYRFWTHARQFHERDAES